MTDKTKAKIEAMAEPQDGLISSYEAAVNGATPWAEWCERFEKLMQNQIDYFHTDTDQQLKMIHLLRRYRQWLEDVDG